MSEGRRRGGDSIPRVVWILKGLLAFHFLGNRQNRSKAPVRVRIAYAGLGCGKAPEDRLSGDTTTKYNALVFSLELLGRDGQLADFCRRWNVRELSLFGSALRDDFRVDSDVDVLVSFHPEAGWSLLDLVAMQEELEALVGRHVDLVEQEALRNPYRRAAILNSRRVLYAA